MGDPVYDERQRLKKERELLQEREWLKKDTRDSKASDLFDLVAQSLTDFLEGRSCLSVERVDDGRSVVRFTKV